ncbi:apoptosis-stimulating of p53 protein 1-like isoform X2 [Babylonia areolata]|uniref:apoptosis-stimulating of p53 protein 1-like isoform X2 n=1 Tax=Babylonia areolata TaxID=304850 RepID=UPI003FD2AA86
MFPEVGTTLTLSELQALAAQQQVAMETQQQALVARETRLRYLQQQEARQHQLCSEEARLQRMRERVTQQELKLKRLRALKGQVEHHRAHNSHLNSELEVVRSLFNQKEKELALAVCRVDSLIQQLHDLREVKAKEVITQGDKDKGHSKALTLELEKLRKELEERRQVNVDHTSHLVERQQLLQHRKDQVGEVDARIKEIQDRLKKRRPHPPPPPPPPPPPAPHTPPGSAERGKEVWGLRGGVVGRNVAAVEPYIQHPPKVKVAEKGGGGWKGDTQPSSATPGRSEVNNSGKDSDQRGGGREAVEEYKIPPIVSSHFDANRLRAGSVGRGLGADNKRGGEGASSELPATHTPVLSQSPATHTPVVTTTVPSVQTVWPPSPTTLNSFGTARALTTWSSPSASKEGGAEPSPPPPHHAPHHPHINICEEERQAGSGQSSPASSEGSGPLVKQGSGAFTHHTPTTHTTGQPTTPTSPPAVVPASQDAHRPGGQPRAQHSGRQAPKPPPRMPQTVLHSKSPVTQLSSSSTPFTSSSAPHPSAPMPVSTVSSSQTAGARSGSNSTLPGGPNPTHSADAASGNSVSSTEQEEGGKGGTTIHLNQRPAPTYRHPSKTLHTSTHTSRVGGSTSQHNHQVMQQLHSTEGSTQPGVAGSKENDRSAARGGDSTRDSGQSADRSPGEGEGGATRFGVVGTPSYPDIASDKGSFKVNTPKQVRRRHSDSDNEELAKALRRRDRGDTDHTTPDPPTPPLPSPATHSPPPSPSRQRPEEGESSQSAVSMRQRKTILKGDNKRKSWGRVSFDPLALLLDACLEGELDLVRRTATQVDDVSRPNDEGITALHNAICAGHYPIVKFLTEFGADVNSPDSDGWTPLHCAASCNNLPMVRFLVEHGACLFATTISDHETAAEKCEEDEDGYDHCSDYLYGVQEKLGIANQGTVYAVFDYSASRQDELSFSINDRLTVTRKGDPEEKEWWWALGPDHREGYVPRNLLGLCPRVLPSSYQPLQTSPC